MEKDLLGTNRFAVVEDIEDFTQERMHLDMFFNIVSKTEVLLMDMCTITKDKDLRRKVTVYQQ